MQPFLAGLRVHAQALASMHAASATQESIRHGPTQKVHARNDSQVCLGPCMWHLATCNYATVAMSGQIPPGRVNSTLVMPKGTLQELGLSGPHEILAKDPRCGAMAIESHGAEDTNREANCLSQP